MSMDSQGKGNKKNLSIVASFRNALDGIMKAIQTERNLKIHLFFTGFIIIVGSFLSLTKLEWALLVLAIGGMLTAEMINSAIERVVDLVTEEYHPLAKQAKDMAAGAVFLFAVTSVLVGLFVLGPKLLMYIQP